MNGAIPPLIPHAFMVCRATTLPLHKRIEVLYILMVTVTISITCYIKNTLLRAKEEV